EASVTIVECADEDIVSEALAPDRYAHARSRAASETEAPLLLLNGYENFASMGDEADVEIVEIVPAFDAVPQPAARKPAPVSLAERLAAAGKAHAGSRFLKALSGSD